MQRITKSMVQARLDYLNRKLNRPATYMTDRNINVGHIHVENSCNSWVIVHTVNESGATSALGDYGTLRDMLRTAAGLIRGIDLKEGL